MTSRGNNYPRSSNFSMRTLTMYEINKLANLPTFIEAISKFAGLLKAPLGKIASLMNEVPSKFARTLTSVKEQKG